MNIRTHLRLTKKEKKLRILVLLKTLRTKNQKNPLELHSSHSWLEKKNFTMLLKFRLRSRFFSRTC